MHFPEPEAARERLVAEIPQFMTVVSSSAQQAFVFDGVFVAHSTKQQINV